MSSEQAAGRSGSPPSTKAQEGHGLMVLTFEGPIRWTITAERHDCGRLVDLQDVTSGISKRCQEEGYDFSFTDTPLGGKKLVASRIADNASEDIKTLLEMMKEGAEVLERELEIKQKMDVLREVPEQVQEEGVYMSEELRLAHKKLFDMRPMMTMG